MVERITIKEPEEKSSLYLTPRELTIIKSVAQGKTSKEVGEELSISWKTVETHRRNIMQRLACSNMAQVVDILHKQGILS